MLHYYHPPDTFITESGVATRLTIAFTTYGSLNANKSNVVWVCHALTANAFAPDWWPGVVGDNCVLNPEAHFIVCANILGSCYGTTVQLENPVAGAENADPEVGPLLTIRDMVAAHMLLRAHLGIEKIALLAGGSMGGYQVLEWALMEPAVPQRLLLLATSAAESAWGIAIHEAQRMAIEADATWKETGTNAGSAGLKAARAIGMLTYRNYALFGAQQSDPETNKTDHFRAAGYQRHQGEKLARRFSARNYWGLTKSLDTHNLARHRAATLEEVLQRIWQPALIIGISSDILCPVPEQQYLAQHMPGATLLEIDSPFGHDGFLVEHAAISKAVADWLPKKAS
jgi:homoserine O-acetyltransferase